MSDATIPNGLDATAPQSRREFLARPLSLAGIAATALASCGGDGNNMPRNGMMPGPGNTNNTGGTPNAPSAGRTFSYLGPNSASLTASSGMGGGMMGGSNATLTMANGAVVPVWTLNSDGALGFNSDRPVPGPLIELVQGQQAAITLSSMMPHTIHPHGLDVNTANDGVPQTSGFVGNAPMMGGDFGRTQGQRSLGSSFTYRFTAPFAGTYFYHCHVDASLHMEMGMYGAVIVRPASGSANAAWDGGPAFDTEYVWQLHTFDSRWHSQSVTGTGTLRYRPAVFMINGRDGANLLSDSTVAIRAPAGSRVLLRLINMGYMPALVNLGGLQLDVIASDGRPLRAPLSTSTQRVAPGERYDLIVTLPAQTATTARVDYQNIRGTRVMGTATTSITAL